jgi:phosphoenolpyruvate carboxykinase (GTP)
MRVLRWVREQALGGARNGHTSSRETPIGIVPTADAIGTRDLGLSDRDGEALFAVDRDDWLREVEDQGEFLQKFGDKLPPEIRKQHEALRARLSPVSV